MGLLDSGAEEPRSKLRRYIITSVVFLVLVALGIWYALRFQTEKNTAESFLRALAAGNTEQAYRIWKPSASYALQDFLEDWGPSGYYGPVKSFRIADVTKPKNSSGVVVVVEVSPYDPFPQPNEVAKQRRTKEVRIWVERRDQSLSFAP